jgi:AmpE protein
MMFLAMMIALSLQQVLQERERQPGDALLLDWEGWLSARVTSPWLQELAVLALPLLVLYWVLCVIDGWLFGLPTLLATAALLLWSLGREDYHTLLALFIAAGDSGERSAGQEIVSSLWLPDDAATAVSALHPTPESQRPAPGEERLLYCGYQRWFAPLFYFLLLGPIAAVAYRSVYLFAVSGRAGRYRDVLVWADWIPVRLLALSFAVTGDFVAVVRAAWPDSASPAPALLHRAALASTPGMDGRGLRDLLYRTAGLWLLVASLLIIAL